jgi:hypothetical protein
MVESMDEAVGRVLKKLDGLKLTDNTLVIFTSDNGGLATTEGGPTGATFNGPLREGKGFLYEGGIRVACIMKWPGKIKPGTVTDEVGCSIDFFDTILDATDIAKPMDVKTDGITLCHAAFHGVRHVRPPICWHYPHYANQGSRPGGAVRLVNYKYIEHYEDGRCELFDLVKDRAESRNLAAEKPESVRHFARVLASFRDSVGARMPTPNPDYRPNPQAKDGTITMHARTALSKGVQLRFEPLPHKNTLGFWTRKEDYAEFEFTLEKPGKFAVEVLQGCGKDSGGSEVEIAVGESRLTFTVKETGGFQNFEAREVGSITIDKAGRQTLIVKPKTKPGAAVMDLRQVVLKPKK